MEKKFDIGWQKIFKEYGKCFNEPHEDMNKITKLFKKNKVKNILDVGCGSGRHVVYFSQKGFDVSGIDNSQEGINISNNWLKETNLHANLKLASFFKKFPFKDNYFDAVISTWSIHHGKEKQVKFSINEIKRVLKPNGLIYISVTSTFKNRPIKEKIKIEPHTWIITKGVEKDVPHHIFTKEMVKEYFKDFEIIDLHKDLILHWCIMGRLKSN